MKIRPVGAELFHADGRTVTVSSRNFAKAPKNVQHGKCRLIIWIIIALPTFFKQCWWTFENGDNKERCRRNVMFRNSGTIILKEHYLLFTKLHSVTHQKTHQRESSLSKYLQLLQLKLLRLIKFEDIFKSWETLFNHNNKLATLFNWPFEARCPYKPNNA
jgi:hypothetical protein